MTNSLITNKYAWARPILSALGLTLGLFALSGCRPATSTPTVFAPPAATAPPATVAETPTLPPATPEPTATAVAPTASATAGSTLIAAPAETPTPDPNLGVGDEVYADQFDGKSGWFWSFSDGVATFLASGGKLNATIKTANSYPRLSGGKPDLKVGDQLLRVTAHPNACGPNDEYGVLFHVNADITDGYAFNIRCDGQARFELLRNYQPTALVDWQTSAAIVPGATADNTLMIWMAKGQFHFYVNDKYLFSASDTTFTEGTYGFILNDRTSGGESVSFTNMTAKAVTPP